MSACTEPAPLKDALKIEPPKPQRFLSLDAFRGAIMLLMASSGLGLTAAAKFFPENAIWQFAATQADHALWTGCHLWDLIQPGFMFMVGVALPWSVANRRARGEPFSKTFFHALWRSLLLILLAVILTSAGSRQTLWIYTMVLAQIGLGYPVLFLLAYGKPWMQWLAAAAILVVYWLLFAMHPLPPPDFDWTSVGVGQDWKFLPGFLGHWEKNANFASAFDQWFLNLFPREKPFVFNPGGYQTLNFVPSLATMIFGLLAGQLVRSSIPLTRKIAALIGFGFAGLVLGELLYVFDICPIVKRIWTPAWTIYSAGWIALLLAGFMAVIEWRGWKRWTFPLVVAGMNPITLYCMWQLIPGFVGGNIKTHLGRRVFENFGPAGAPIAQRLSVLFVMWLILFWMYRRKIFVRL